MMLKAKTPPGSSLGTPSRGRHQDKPSTTCWQPPLAWSGRRLRRLSRGGGPAGLRWPLVQAASHQRRQLLVSPAHAQQDEAPRMAAADRHRLQRSPLSRGSWLWRVRDSPLIIERLLKPSCPARSAVTTRISPTSDRHQPEVPQRRQGSWWTPEFLVKMTKDWAKTQDDQRHQMPIDQLYVSSPKGKGEGVPNERSVPADYGGTPLRLRWR